MNIVANIQKAYTPKQQVTLFTWLKEQPLITILSGGKRSGKTYLLVFMFLLEARRYMNMNRQFIIVGATTSAVRRNILNEMENYLGRPIKLGKYNEFDLFGNKCYIFGGDSSDSYKQIRGFTSSLTLISEATTLHEEAIKEAMDRTSGITPDGRPAKILMDTNPENPSHFVKTNYVDKGGERNADGQLVIYTEHFCMLDNTTLSQEYLQRQLTVYPLGSVDYKRHVLGHWVAKEGVIYYMFNEERHCINFLPAEDGVVKYFASMDWGFEHYGAFLVIAKLRSGKFVVLKEIVAKHKSIGWWVNQAKQAHAQYGLEFIYCDEARMDYINDFQTAKLPAIQANKSVVEGIDYVCELLNTDSLLIMKSACPHLIKEMYSYSWKEDASKEVPEKKWDDALDSLRYGLYTNKGREKVSQTYSNVQARSGYTYKR